MKIPSDEKREFKDTSEPLRSDVRMLGDLLGATIREQDGQHLFDMVEEIRRLAKSARQGSTEDRSRLIRAVSSLPPRELLQIARAFSQFLNLVNIAEQHHKIRRRRSYQRQEEAHPQGGSLEELLPRLLSRGITAKKIAESLTGLQIEFVLTAHPTEVTRRTLIQKYNDIAQMLEGLDHDDLTPGERNEYYAHLRRLVTSTWNTDEIRHWRPDPIDEAKWGIAVIEQTLWQAVPRFLREFDSNLRKHTGGGLPIGTSPIHFASWMGGDRDGNPNVTAVITEEVCNLARWKAAELYKLDIERMRFDLSMHHCSKELRAAAGDSPEPYRALLRSVTIKLAATSRWFENKFSRNDISEESIYTDTDQLRQPLLLCYRSLVECGMSSIAEGDLLDILRRLDCFGLSLLRLDIRQDAAYHEQVIDSITRAIGLDSYAEWDEAEKQAFLLRELQSKRPLIPRGLKASDAVREVLDTFSVLASQSAGALGAYIISMASKPSDVLAVMLLLKEAGMSRFMPVVPLFETLDDLNNAADCIDNLLSLDWYRAAIDGHQQIMIGYSDSAKDAGFLAASWAQYRAQENLAQICKKHGVHLTFFHGRGGSVSRGGAPAHAALLSQPPGSLTESIRVTEQGEVIRFKFGLVGVALRTFDVYTSAMIEATLIPPPVPRPEWRKVMEELAETSLRAYRRIVREDSRFVEYFRHTTPERELQYLPIGSRPVRRKVDGGVESLRAIPWVFAWTQVRLMLPVWLGAGEALEELIKRGHEETIKEMANQWPFFGSVLDMLEMVLAKADPEITEYYEQRLAPENIRALGMELRESLTRTIAIIKRITNHNELLEQSPILRRSIEVRNPYIDPLNLLQAEILHRTRSDGTIKDQALELALMVTIAGIAAGMRNTG